MPKEKCQQLLPTLVIKHSFGYAKEVAKLRKVKNRWYELEDIVTLTMLSEGDF